MTERVQLGWRVPADAWENFENYVSEKWSCEGSYLRFEMECAMREFIDEDDILTEAEDLLREVTDSRELSSSSVLLRDERYRGTTTKKIMHRVNTELKERFQIFADEHEASSYGRLMACALESYADGGRARRVLDRIKQSITCGTNSGTTPDSDENGVSSGTDRGTTEAADERLDQLDLSSTTDRGTTADTTCDESDDDVEVQARNVIDIANNLPTDIIPKPVLEQQISDVVGRDDDNVLEAYRQPVLDQIHASEHPHNERIYITDEYRESETIYADLDRSEAIILLRRYAAAEAVKNSDEKRKFTYKNVQQLFEDYAGGGAPSHNHVYKLMRAAPDVDGFKFGQFRGQYQLRVDLHEVDDAVIEWVLENMDVNEKDLQNLSVDGSVTSYTSGSGPQQDGYADD